MSYDNELYQQVILDHNRKPRNFHELENATHSCHGVNPLCGDDMTVYLDVDEEHGVLRDISFMGTGCAISKASSSLMTAYLKGKSLEEVRVIFQEFHKMVLGEMDPEKQEHHLGKLKLFRGIREYPSRTKCASLAWHTMIGALDKKSEGISTE
ncbi:MAG: SUF system NifU family Fe-S cluster assembly protein [Nitrospinae bacterium]|jgi:nitrogen fixation protein NifU and related proteins|nr:SUF system NifU family Fe-S cluster assembly protein [Nitrospinota bacterium]MDA1109422.1 SUF system NifU family Fe-S cluster assembly protein [Nitrospinota bacterium]